MVHELDRNSCMVVVDEVVDEAGAYIEEKVVGFDIGMPEDMIDIGMTVASACAVVRTCAVVVALSTVRLVLVQVVGDVGNIAVARVLMQDAGFDDPVHVVLPAQQQQQ